MPDPTKVATKAADKVFSSAPALSQQALANCAPFLPRWTPTGILLAEAPDKCSADGASAAPTRLVEVW